MIINDHCWSPVITGDFQNLQYFLVICPLCPFITTIIMWCRKISTDLRYTILVLGASHSVPEISALTTVSHCQIYRIRKNWEMTGSMEPEHTGKKTGRPRFLTRNEEVVCLPSNYWAVAIDEIQSQYVVACVERTPDIYLEDLQSQLVTNLGVMVSWKLIWETLHRNRLTMKKVGTCQPILVTEVEFQMSSGVSYWDRTLCTQTCGICQGYAC